MKIKHIRNHPVLPYTVIFFRYFYNPTLPPRKDIDGIQPQKIETTKTSPYRYKVGSNQL